MWGVAPKQERVPGRGAYRMVSIIEKPSDWKQLSAPVITHDEKQSEADFDFIRDAVGDLTPVQLVGRKKFNFHMMHWYCDYRGLDNLLYDLYDEPEMVHDVMRFFADGIKSMLRQYEEQNLISLNNDRTFHFTGGVGYTDLLPQPDYEPDRIRLCDVWGAAEAQEFAQISPEMHEEFVLQYERNSAFGSTVTAAATTFPKAGRSSEKCTCAASRFAPGGYRKIRTGSGENYIMTWKPMPMPLAGIDTELVRKLENGIRKARGGVLELILRDTHTCRKKPERFGQWWKSPRH